MRISNNGKTIERIGSDKVNEIAYLSKQLEMGIHKWAFKVDYHPDNDYGNIFTGVMTRAQSENSKLTNANKCASGVGVMSILDNPRSQNMKKLDL